MAVEALCALGRADAVDPWLARYRAELLPMPARRERITRDDWRTALSHADRAADWSAFFAAELVGAPWRQVLDDWVGPARPGAVRRRDSRSDSCGSRGAHPVSRRDSGAPPRAGGRPRFVGLRLPGAADRERERRARLFRARGDPPRPGRAARAPALHRHDRVVARRPRPVPGVRLRHRLARGRRPTPRRSSQISRRCSPASTSRTRTTR